MLYTCKTDAELVVIYQLEDMLEECRTKTHLKPIDLDVLTQFKRTLLDLKG